MLLFSTISTTEMVQNARMSPEPASIVRQRADELSGGATEVKGPLKGYHHETYVFQLPGKEVRVKCREPRDGLLWFDRRCFQSEEQLLGALRGHVEHIPDVYDVGGVDLQRFIEGRTLGAGYGSGRPVPPEIFEQIVELFQDMLHVPPAKLGAVGRRCRPEDRPENGDSAGFLERLIHFTEHSVYEENLGGFGELFWSLGVNGDAFKRLREKASGLRSRPFSLLHADLHRENFIIDRSRRLWAIDWELAMVGDPLYDLATHLYLMRYPQRQEQRMKEQWCRLVEEIHPGSSRDHEQDLAVILEYKKAQSVFTDVIRNSLPLRGDKGLVWEHVPRAAWRIQKVLLAAADPLGLPLPPSMRQIVTALVQWHRGPKAHIPTGADRPGADSGGITPSVPPFPPTPAPQWPHELLPHVAAGTPRRSPAAAGPPQPPHTHGTSGVAARRE